MFFNLKDMTLKLMLTKTNMYLCMHIYILHSLKIKLGRKTDIENACTFTTCLSPGDRYPNINTHNTNM